MEKDIKTCIECYEGPESGAPAGNKKGLNIINDINDMYNEQLKKLQDDSESEGALKLQLNTLQDWVCDLMEQNKILVKTIEELEAEALKRHQNTYPVAAPVAAPVGLEEVRQVGSSGLPGPNRKSSEQEETEHTSQQLVEYSATTKKSNDLTLSSEKKYLEEIKNLKQTLENEQNKKMSETRIVAHRSVMTDVYDSGAETFIFEETLAEVLGITEKSQSAKQKVEQLQLQLESKDQLIACLEERIKNSCSSDLIQPSKTLREQDGKLEAAEAALFRITQQVDWFTDNVLQQCRIASVGKQFENYLQIQLAELHECLIYPDCECDGDEEPLTPETPISSGSKIFTCKGNLSSKTVTLLPARALTYSSNSQKSETKKLKSEIREQAVEIARLEDTLDQTNEHLLTLHESSCRQFYHQQDSTATSQRLIELQKDVEEAHNKMAQSWAKLRELSQQMSCKVIQPELEQYKLCATKEQSTLNRLQMEINTLLTKLATRDMQANRMTQLIDSLRNHLIVVQNQLEQGLSCTGANLQIWIKTIQDSLSAAQAQLVEIERSAMLMKNEREEFARTQRVEETLVRSLQQELQRSQQASIRAFDKLCQSEKLHRKDWNNLVSSVVNHHDICKQEQVASDDMKQEINQLVTSLSAKAKQLQSQEEIIKNLQQTLSDTRSQNQRFHKRRSLTVDTDGDDEEGYHTLAKTQQEVETLRQMVNMRDRQILEKEQKISTLKKALSKTRSDVRGGRFPTRVSVPPTMSKVGEVEEYRQHSLQIQAIVSRIQMEVLSTFTEIEHRDQQISRLVENLQKGLDIVQQEFNASNFTPQEEREEMVIKLKSAMCKCQKSLKYCIRKMQDVISQKGTSESSRTQLQSRMKALQTELETAHDDLLDQLQNVSQEEIVKPNSPPAGIKVEKLQLELEQNKKYIIEMESRSKSAEDQNQKLKLDLAKAQEELNRVRSLPTWKKSMTGTSDNFKMQAQQCSYAEMEKNIETQQETIHVLQNSLKLEHEESDELRKKILKLESQKDNVKIEYQQKIDELESAVSSLQDTRKKSDEATKKHQKAVAALQIVICNLNGKVKAHDSKMDGTIQVIKEHEQKAANQVETVKKYEKKIQNLQKDLTQRDKEISALNVKVNEFVSNASKEREIKEMLKTSKKEQNLFQNKITDLSKQLTAEKEKSTKLSLELNLAMNETERERKLGIIHKQRIEEVTETLSRKSEEMSELDLSYNEVRCQYGDAVKEIKSLKEQMKHLKKKYQMEVTNSTNESMRELQDQIQDLTNKLNIESGRSVEAGIELKKVQEKLLQAAKKEAIIHQEYTQKEGEWMERLRESQIEVFKLTDVITSLTDELSGIKSEIEFERSKHAITKKKLEDAEDLMETLKAQLNEKEGVAGKLHSALTHLSLKVVSNVQNLENKESLLKQCEEQLSLVKSELQEKTAEGELKDDQVINLKLEIDKLRSQLEVKEQNKISRKESMIQILEHKIEELTVELESCKYMQTRDSECVAALLSEKAEELARKDEEIITLEMQLKKSSIQRDKLEAELNIEHEKLLKFQESNTNLTYNLKQLEHSKNQLLVELESMKKLVDELRNELKCHNESADLELKQQSQQIVDNAQHCISEQRQFSLSLATQLRYTKQELKSIKQENRVLLDSVKSLKVTNHGLEKQLRTIQNESMDADTMFDLTNIRRGYDSDNFRSKSNISLHEQPLMEVKLKPTYHSTHSGLSSSSKGWHLSSGDTDKSEYKNWKRRIQNLAQTSTMDDSKESFYYSSST